MREQKDLALFIGIVAAMAILASSAHWWLPKLLQFVISNTNLIQGLSDFIQILLWLGVLLIFIRKLYLRSFKEKGSHHSNKIHPESESQEIPSSKQSSKQVGTYSVRAEKITGFVQGENNRVTNHFNDTSSGD
jgi:hypothetical protein